MKLSDQVEYLDDSKRNYLQQLNGALLYAAISTRPDIAHAVGVVSRYNAKAQLQHLTAAKRVFHYLQGAKPLKLVMDGNHINNKSTSTTPILTAYSDSDYAGDLEDRKSTSGYVIKLNNCPIYWVSKKQKTVAKSTCEAEIIALADLVKELQWIINFLVELKIFKSVHLKQPAIIYCDNKSTVAIAKQDMASTKTKHIAVNYYFIKQALDDGLVQYESIKSEDNLADIFTKPLGRTKFDKFKFMLMGEC
jgi:hypothetical protein